MVVGSRRNGPGSLQERLALQAAGLAVLGEDKPGIDLKWDQ